MKKTKFLGAATLCLALGLVACSKEPEVKYEQDKTYHWQKDEAGAVVEGSKVKHTFAETAEKSIAATCSAAGKKVETCSVCGYEKETNISKLSHNLVDSPEDSVEATCAKPGKSVKKCTACDFKEETPLTAAHAFGDATVIHDKETDVKSKLSKKVCGGTDCGKTDLIVDAMSYTVSGSTSSSAFGNKDESGATLKMSKNGNYVEYKIITDKAYTGCEVALYGYVDFWKDGKNDNDQKGHIVSGSATFELKVNDTAVAVTNNKSFEEMGMVAGENGNGSFTLCYLGGTIDLAAGENTIRYERVASFNLNISEIHFIG